MENNMKKLILAIAALAAIAPVAASAQYHSGQHYGQRYDQRYEFRGYDRAGNPVYSYRDQRYNRDNRYDYRDNRHRDRRWDDRRCRDGSTGTIVGAIAGGLLGRTVDTRGDRTAGTVVGGVGGALAGRAIDRNCR
jgi:uncharacterized protein YcfJ